MATIADVVDGLNILRKYWPNSDVSAEHDVLYAGGDQAKVQMQPGDLELLEKLHWRYNSTFDCWQRYT